MARAASAARAARSDDEAEQAARQPDADIDFSVPICVRGPRALGRRSDAALGLFREVDALALCLFHLFGLFVVFLLSFALIILSARLPSGAGQSLVGLREPGERIRSAPRSGVCCGSWGALLLAGVLLAAGLVSRCLSEALLLVTLFFMPVFPRSLLQGCVSSSHVLISFVLSTFFFCYLLSVFSFCATSFFTPVWLLRGCFSSSRVPSA